MQGTERSLDDITGEIVDAAYRLHKGLGPGLLESVYEVVLARDLERRGLRAARQEPVSFEYDGLEFRDCLRIDLLVQSRVVVEIKSVERVLPVHGVQLVTYLRLMKLSVGLLINFGAPTLKEGLQRFVNQRPPSASPREQSFWTIESVSPEAISREQRPDEQSFAKHWPISLTALPAGGAAGKSDAKIAGAMTAR